MKTFVVALAFEVHAAFAGCPSGSLQSVDRYGRPVCMGWWNLERRCPDGTRPFMDGRGNHGCEEVGTMFRYYDLAKGCPSGAYLSIDPGDATWTCKFF